MYNVFFSKCCKSEGGRIVHLGRTVNENEYTEAQAMDNKNNTTTTKTTTINKTKNKQNKRNNKKKTNNQQPNKQETEHKSKPERLLGFGTICSSLGKQ
jgi:hypothetical protein